MYPDCKTTHNDNYSFLMHEEIIRTRRATILGLVNSVNATIQTWVFSGEKSWNSYFLVNIYAFPWMLWASLTRFPRVLVLVFFCYIFFKFIYSSFLFEFILMPDNITWYFSWFGCCSTDILQFNISFSPFRAPWLTYSVAIANGGQPEKWPVVTAKWMKPDLLLQAADMLLPRRQSTCIRENCMDIPTTCISTSFWLIA